MDAVLTIDVDMMDYLTGKPLDEMRLVFPRIRQSLQEYPDVKTTWFLRIDSHMQSLYGKETFIFERYAREIQWLQSKGHEIAWHYHGYKYEHGQWRQNVDELEISEELLRYGEIAKKMDLTSVRMGWAFHTNRTMRILNELGFTVDSSAIPRPGSAEKPSAVSANWNDSPQEPYQPCVHDYRLPGKPHLQIWEVPISTTPLSVPEDRNRSAVRYVNPAYRSDIFSRALQTLQQRSFFVLICHPYELLSNSLKHPLLAFDFRQFAKNLESFARLKYNFRTLREMVI